jgi:phosphatidylinositol kinase/protein kinase (PI-3  family)
MVPFRLTQNVVDAFGITGVEGTFRRSAETTLQVLMMAAAPRHGLPL